MKGHCRKPVNINQRKHANRTVKGEKACRERERACHGYIVAGTEETSLRLRLDTYRKYGIIHNAVDLVAIRK